MFIVHDFHVGPTGTVTIVDTTDPTATHTAAFALVATGDITIEGTPNAYSGSHSDATCNGGHGDVTDSAVQPQTGASGGGGFEPQALRAAQSPQTGQAAVQAAACPGLRPSFRFAVDAPLAEAPTTMASSRRSVVAEEEVSS